MKLFSVPLNSELSEEELNHFILFLKEHKEFIFDVYFTSRLMPFNQDAMGQVVTDDDYKNQLINVAIKIQNETGIPVCATFNDINVPPAQELLLLFIEKFKTFYDLGVRYVTIPNSHWVATGELKKEFPDLFIKNTVLRNVSRANEIIELAKIGYNYISIDRDLMRNRDVLIEIKNAKEYCKHIGLPVYISLLVNEGCFGNCSFMDEHYCYNLEKVSSNVSDYFDDPISRVSCKMRIENDKNSSFKIANISPWKEDLDELHNECGIDIFKLHGRRDKYHFIESLKVIENYANDEVYLFEDFKKFIENKCINNIDDWRTKIKNCKFDCWKCGFCDKIL